MDAAAFVHKWRDVSLTERSASQQHILDLCDLVGHPKPAEVDKTGESFTFERGAAKHGGGEGWADVWKKGYFGWECKGLHKDLDKAYDQLLKYREALLVVCDMNRPVVHTNFTNTPARAYEVALDRLDREPRLLEVLRAAFHAPERLKPGATSEAITEEAAGRLAAIAQELRDRGLDPEEVAHFLDRIVCCLFAEDVELPPDVLFTRILTVHAAIRRSSRATSGSFSPPWPRAATSCSATCAGSTDTCSSRPRSSS